MIQDSPPVKRLDFFERYLSLWVLLCLSAHPGFPKLNADEPMKISEFTKYLTTHPDAGLCFVLPDGDLIPAHAHITEVGRVDKTFIDCGGTVRTVSTCNLQAWVAADDEAHRFAPGQLAKVLAKAEAILRGDDLELEIEYEDCAITQFPVLSAHSADGILSFTLGEKHTACLAPDVCLVPEKGSTAGGSCC